MGSVRIGAKKLRFEYIDIIYVFLRLSSAAASFIWVFFHPGAPPYQLFLYYLIAFLAVYSALFYLFSLSRPGRFKQLYLWLLVPDTIFITLMVHFTGELQSPFMYGYFLIAALHAFYYGLHTGLAVAGVVSCAYAIHLYHYLVEEPVYLGNIFAALAFVWLLAIFGGLLGEKEVKDREKIEQLNEELRDLYSQTAFERDKLDAILAGMADGVFTVDRDLKLVSFNQAAEAIAGWKGKDVIGKTCGALFQSTDKKGRLICGSPACPLEKAIAKGRTVINFEHKIKTKSGQIVDVSSSVAPLKDETGEVAGGVSVFRDITKLKEIEQMKSDFVSMVSHELRSPLTSIKGFAATLLREKKFDETTRRKFLNVIENESDRLTRLVEDLLNISRIEEGRFRLERTTFSLPEMVSEVLSAYKEKTKKHRFVLKSPPRLSAANGDESRLRQVFENLVGNAVKFSPSGGIITVEIKEKAHRFTGAVGDQGIGMPREDLERVFEKFYRVDSSVTRETGGSGLGLSIAKSIVEAHGGRIWAESKGEGKGSVFHFTLPKKITQKKQGKL